MLRKGVFRTDDWMNWLTFLSHTRQGSTERQIDPPRCVSMFFNNTNRVNVGITEKSRHLRLLTKGVTSDERG